VSPLPSLDSLDKYVDCGGEITSLLLPLENCNNRNQGCFGSNAAGPHGSGFRLSVEFLFKHGRLLERFG